MSLPAPERQRAIHDLARAVDLTNIRTVEFSAQLLEQPPEIQPVALAVNSDLKTGQVPGGFVVEARFSLKARTGAEGGHDFLELLYRVGAVYSFAGTLPPDEVLGAFAETNGMIHLWPYFRAYVQQTCAQLGIAPIILSPFRLAPARTEPQGGPPPTRN